MTIAAFLLAGGQAVAAEPLEITARQTLEWHRTEKEFVAQGSVVVRQGAVTIRADRLTAHYRGEKSSDFDIHRLTAEGHVQIESQGSTAAGDKAVYDVAGGTATMTGKNLNLTSPDQTVTAHDSFQYHVADGHLSASGDVKVTRGEDVLKADRVDAWFAADRKGQRTLSKMTAEGHIVITTPDENLHGSKASYDASSSTAQVSGNVRIERGPNVLEGESADVNLDTNVSTIHGDATEGGRVRGVFYPGSAEKNVKPEPAAPAAEAPAALPSVEPAAPEFAPAGPLTAP